MRHQWTITDGIDSAAPHGSLPLRGKRNAFVQTGLQPSPVFKPSFGFKSLSDSEAAITKKTLSVMRTFFVEKVGGMRHQWTITDGIDSAAPHGSLPLRGKRNAFVQTGLQPSPVFKPSFGFKSLSDSEAAITKKTLSVMRTFFVEKVGGERRIRIIDYK